MDTKRIIHIIICLLAIFFMIAQAAPKTMQQLMDESLETKLQAFKRVVEKKCELNIQERAQEIVDSLLLREAQLKTVDSFKRPPVPNKPEHPEIKSAKDTTDIKPLFDEGRKDQ